ncbi:hypothetical protein HPB50_025019 [Hyalomma asiaticum]|uniref:Uncharacterized protein n=1 Tax=Hyalomma asiaticum TaxID=266040 RepID=A0ACB7S409_HYAAI|nr:hypothetical protein HPB50_025019 [Hyalomma asiaticum]
MAPTMRFFRSFLGNGVRGKYEEHLTEEQIRKHLRLADKMTEFLGRVPLRQLRDMVNRVHVCAAGKDLFSAFWDLGQSSLCNPNGRNLNFCQLCAKSPSELQNTKLPGSFPRA